MRRAGSVTAKMRLYSEDSTRTAVCRPIERDARTRFNCPAHRSSMKGMFSIGMWRLLVTFIVSDMSASTRTFLNR
eukprot:1044023-Prymnesium_polylepis.2